MKPLRAGMDLPSSPLVISVCLRLSSSSFHPPRFKQMWNDRCGSNLRSSRAPGSFLAISSSSCLRFFILFLQACQLLQSVQPFPAFHTFIQTLLHAVYCVSPRIPGQPRSIHTWVDNQRQQRVAECGLVLLMCESWGRALLHCEKTQLARVKLGVLLIKQVFIRVNYVPTACFATGYRYDQNMKISVFIGGTFTRQIC